MVAERPSTQAKLFLLLDALTHVHIHCVSRAFLGKRKYDPTSKFDGEPPVEDDFAGYDLGVSSFVRSLIKPLEAQGRGSAHGHQKFHSEPATKCIDLLRLLSEVLTESETEKALEAWQHAHRESCLADAATKQYDSAVVSGEQLGVTQKEVFTQKQRERARLDGGVEEDGTEREGVQVVPRPVPAHVQREQNEAEALGRPLRDAYRAMPLSGAPSARFPQYLMRSSFGQQQELDDAGHAPENLEPPAAASERCQQGMVDENSALAVNEHGEVTGLRLPSGAIASEEQLQADGVRYAQNWAKDVRMCHTCKAICFKNSVPAFETQKPHSDEAKQAPRPSCRFRFFASLLC